MGPSYRTTYQTKQQSEPVADPEARVLSPKNSLPGPNLAHVSSSRRRRAHSSRRATKWGIIAGIVALCLFLYITHLTNCFKKLHSRQLLTPSERDLLARPIDVVAVSLKPSCVTRQAVLSLNAHLRPRTIHIVTTGPEKCATFAGFAPNVACHLQDDFLPGLTAERVGHFLKTRLGLDQHKRLRGRELSGWYMQQLIKLGSVLALPGLSEHYLVWDLDMVLLAPLQLLWWLPPQRDDLPGGGEDAAAAAAGGAGGAADVAAGGAGGEAGQVQTLVNIGGSISSGYIASFRRLFGRGLEFAPDGSSFVTHWMVIYKPYLREFLRELTAGGGAAAGATAAAAAVGAEGPVEEETVVAVNGGSSSGAGGAGNGAAGGGLDWAWRILGAVDPRTADLGFSEYASYISWVRQRYPGSQRLAPRKTWVRHPFGQGAVRLLRLLRADRCCCPSGALLQLLRALGFVYTGYEVGHIAECRYDAPEHATSYGL